MTLFFSQELIEHWEDFSNLVDKLRQVVYTAETLLPTEDAEKVPSRELEQQLKDTKVSREDQGPNSLCYCVKNEIILAEINTLTTWK